MAGNQRGLLPFGPSSAMVTATGALGVRVDPYLAHNFLVEIDGIVAGGFATVAGLDSTIAVEDHPEGGVNGYVNKSLAASTSPPLVLSKGLTELDMLWMWFEMTRAGVIRRKHVTVMLLDAARLPVTWWTFADAIPVRWRGPSFDASASVVAVESIELVHRGMTRPAMAAATALARRVIR